MKKIVLHICTYAACILLAASCSKDVKQPVNVANTSSKTTTTATTTTTTTTTQNQGGHTCGGDGSGQGYNSDGAH